MNLWPPYRSAVKQTDRLTDRLRDENDCVKDLPTEEGRSPLFSPPSFLNLTLGEPANVRLPVRYHPSLRKAVPHIALKLMFYLFCAYDSQAGGSKAGKISTRGRSSGVNVFRI